MAYKEIVTKAVLGKGRKLFTTTKEINVNPKASTVLGCWVINHVFKGYRNGNNITIEGSYDVNLWYSYDNDTKTDVIKVTDNYLENVNVKNKVENDFSTNEEIIIESLTQPSCIRTIITNNGIEYTIEKNMGIELVGDTKVKIEINDVEDPWDDLIDEEVEEKIEQEIEETVTEEFLP